MKERNHVDASSIAVFAAVAYFGLSLWVLSRGHPHEDAYILFTYAEHFAAGDGIVYFAGGEHTEGATDFLWMILLGGFTYVGIDVAVAAAVLNALGIGVITYFLGANLTWHGDRPSRMFAMSCLAVILLASDITAASISGFSTGFYCAVAMSVLHLLLNAGSAALRCLPWLSILLGLIRPDGVVIGVAAVIIGLLLVWNTKFRVSYCCHAVGAAVLGIGYFVWRLTYFGHTLPLPLYVKGYGRGSLSGLVPNAEYAVKYSVLVLVGVVNLAVVRHTKRYVLSLLPFLALVVVLTFVHQSQNISYRFQAPLSGALLIALAIFLGNYLETTAVRKKWITVGLIVPVIFVGAGARPGHYLNLARGRYIDQFPFMIRDALSPDTKIALTEAGRMAYWTDCKTYDLVGLNTAHVAVNQLDAGYLEQLNPDVVFVHTAATLRSFSDANGNTLDVEADFFARQALQPRFPNNPVVRAPMLVYQYLRDNSNRYRIVFARYGKEFSHLYAVRKGSEVDWEVFRRRLDASFDDTERISYLDMKSKLLP